MIPLISVGLAVFAKALDGVYERHVEASKEDERKHRDRLAEEDAKLAFDIDEAAKRSLARALDKQRGER